MRRRDFLIAGASAGVASTLLPSLATAAAPCPPPTVAVAGGSSSTTTCDPPPPTTGMVSPAYLNSLASFEARVLSGGLAPSNGKATMQSVTPSEWLNSDPGDVGLAAVLSAWSGGIGDSATGRLFVLGGGHGDSANNGIYTYDFSGSSAPTGFSVQSGSQSSVGAVPGIVQGNSTNFVQYSDGRPSAKHTYDGVVYANGKIYMFGGGSWGAGGFTNDIWQFQNGGWTRMPAPPFGTDRPWTAYDPTTHKVLYFNPGGQAYAFFNTDTNKWGSLKSLANNFNASDAILCHDTTRHRVFVLGSNFNRLWTLNWSGESISEGTYTSSSVLSDSAVTGLYDSARDRIWIIGGKTAGYGTLYEMNPTSFVITPHALSGDTVPTASTAGSFKRAVLLGNGIGTVTTVNGPAVVIRLP